MARCRKCQSNNVWFTKHVHEGKKQEMTFHYKLHCKDCKTSYYTQRTKEIYELIKEDPWIKKKRKAFQSRNFPHNQQSSLVIGKP